MDLMFRREDLEFVYGDDVMFTVDDHVYMYGGEEYPSVTTLIHEKWPINSIFYSAYPDATARGVAIHETTELLDKGDITLEDVVNHRIECGQWDAFLKRIKADVLKIEEVFINLSWGYAGTADRVVLITTRDSKALLDIKTGKHAKWHNLQLGAYAWAYPDVTEAYVIQLAKGKNLASRKCPLEFSMNAWADLMVNGPVGTIWTQFRHQ